MITIDTVCLIDDDPIFVYGTKVILNRNSDFCPNIMVYENGSEALEDLSRMVVSHKNLPEVIFLDLNMPVMNGWEFLDEFIKLPEITSKTKIYILSSSLDANDVKKASEYEIVKDFIVKPLTEANFSNLLKEIEQEVLS